MKALYELVGLLLGPACAWRSYSLGVPSNMAFAGYQMIDRRGNLVTRRPGRDWKGKS